MPLRLDPASHSYYLGRNRLPGVTEVLTTCRVIDSTWWSDSARERGKAVHEALHFYDEKDLDQNTVDPAIRPYLDAYEKFLADSGAEVLASEHMVHSRVFGYAGTLDRVLRLNKRAVLVDIKTGARPLWVGMQVAAYRRAAQENGLDTFAGFCLQLDAKGNYRLHRESEADLADFLEILKVFWRIHGQTYAAPGGIRPGGAPDPGKTAARE